MTPVKPASAGLILFITTVSTLAASFTNSSVNVALPPIGTEFQLGGVTLNWVVTAFVLFSSIFVLPLGKVADRRGREAVFRWGSVLYALGSVASWWAPDAGWLIAARALTGLGGAAVAATATAMVVDAYPPAQRGRVLGINVSMVYLGLSAGPVLGGLIVQTLGWRGLFAVHAVAALVVTALVFLRLRTPERPSHGEGRFDTLGSVLFAGGLALLLVGVSDLPGALGIALTLAGAAVLVGFWLVETKAAHPILPVTLFTKNQVFAAANLAALLSYSATFAVAFFLSLYLQVVRGLPPAAAGGLLIVQPLVQAAFSPLTGRLSDRVSPGVLASLGMALTSLGLLVLTFVDASTPLPVLLGALVLLGLGFALFSSPNTNSIMGSVSKTQLGVASATVSTVRGVGMMLSMGLALVLLSLHLGTAAVGADTADAFLGAQKWAFGVSAVLCALGVVASSVRGKASS